MSELIFVHRKCYYLKFRIVQHYKYCCASSHFRIVNIRDWSWEGLYRFIYIIHIIPTPYQSIKQAIHPFFLFLHRLFDAVFFCSCRTQLFQHLVPPIYIYIFIYIYINLRYTHLLTHLRSLLFLFGFLFFWDSESGIVKAEEV